MRFSSLLKAANALTRLSNTYQIPIHKLSGDDDSAIPMDFREINRIAQHYKEKARLRVRISAFITPEKRFGDKLICLACPTAF